MNKLNLTQLFSDFIIIILYHSIINVKSRNYISKDGW